MTRSLWLALLVLLLPTAVQAADCIAVHDGQPVLLQDAACKGLELRSRRGEDVRRNVEVSASWVEYAVPASPEEWRYNAWIAKRLAVLDFDNAKAGAAVGFRENRLAVQSFYRSERLISARYGRSTCCGTRQVGTTYSSISIDSERWTLLSPDDLVSLGKVADACRQQFAGDEARGADFVRVYPLERALADGDFYSRRIGPVVLDLIGSVIIPANPSEDRTRRVFIAVLKDQGRWSFSEHGALIEFGQLLGIDAGPFTCTLPNDALRTMAARGAAFPP